MGGIIAPKKKRPAPSEETSVTREETLKKTTADRDQTSLKYDKRGERLRFSLLEAEDPQGQQTTTTALGGIRNPLGRVRK